MCERYPERWVRSQRDAQVRGRDGNVGRGIINLESVYPQGARVHLSDDLICSGRTLRSALDALELIGLAANSASAILWARRVDASVPDLVQRGFRPSPASLLGVRTLAACHGVSPPGASV